MGVEGFIDEKTGILFGRLGPETEIFKGITELCDKMGVEYGSIISCIGSFKETRYTYPKNVDYNVLGIGFQEPLYSDTLCEVISGQGTIGYDKDKNREIHIHVVMCDVDGKVTAGHLMPGCITAATMEITIAVAKSGSIIRSIDEELKLPLFRFKELR